MNETESKEGSESPEANKNSTPSADEALPAKSAEAAKRPADTTGSATETGPSERRGARKAKKQPDPVDSLDQLIERFYQAKRVTIGKPLKSRLRVAPRMSQDTVQRLLQLVDTDKRLVVPRRLLLAAMDLDAPTDRDVRDFVQAALLRHPLFQHPEVSRAISEGVGRDAAVRVIRLAVELCTSRLEGEKKGDDGIASTVANTLATWFVVAGDFRPDDVPAVLYESHWRAVAEGAKGRALRILTEIEDPTAVGLACSTFREAEAATRMHSRRAETDALEANARANSLKERVEAEQRTNEQLREDLEEALRALDAANAKYSTLEAHSRDDLERLRARIRRRLRNEIPLLENGLMALGRTPPNVDVMIDHADRALEGLRKELAELEKETQG